MATKKHSKTTRAKARKRINADKSRLSYEETLDRMSRDLMQVKACIVTAVMAVEHRGGVDRELSTMLRMSALLPMESAQALVRSLS